MTTTLEYQRTDEQEPGVAPKELVVDDAGRERLSYQVDPNTKVVFRARDEMPTFGSTGTEAEILTTDEIPLQKQIRSDFQDYVQRSVSMEEKDEKTYIASATPVGLIDLALKLRDPGKPIDELLKMRENFLQTKIGAQENALLDAMSAEMFSSPDGVFTLDVTDGLLEIVESLNGSEQARGAIKEKLEVQSEWQKGFVTRELADTALFDTMLERSMIDPEIIEQAKGKILVRTTTNLPEIDDKGVVHMHSAADHTRHLPEDSTGKYVPRGTVHFAMNHLVQDHMDSSFSTEGSVVIAPLGPALEANGAPAALAGVDTFFEVGPNETVDLPDATVVSSGGDQSELLRTEGNEVTYKSEGYSDDDIDAFVQIYGFGLRDLLANRKLISEQDARNTNPIRDIVDDETLRGVMPSALRSLAVDNAINALGGTIQTSDAMGHYINNKQFSEELQDLSDKLSTVTLLHDTTPQHWLEDKAYYRMYPINGDERQANGILARKDISPSLRRLFINDGHISVSQKPKPVFDNSGI